MELVRFPSSRGFSVRSILTFVFAVVIAALLAAPFLSKPASAAPTAEWSGPTIIYDNHAFEQGNNFTDTSATIPEGSSVYKTIILEGATPNDKKVMVLYFAPGVDPPSATSASFVSFKYKDGELSDPSGKTDVSLAVKGTESATSSCAVSGGLGWIVCPISVFMADAIDKLFDIMANKMLKTQPLILGDTSNSLYIAWNLMRTIANILFVIGFLVIIYSQLTGVGISSYGVKRTLPRLIVAAVLVNISFIISALAVDLSNILGVSLQDLFNTIRENVFNLTDDNLGGLNSNWGSITNVVLAGGGVVAGLYYVGSAAYFYLIPLLLFIGLTVFFVVAVLAARQAIIIILIILSPLAFVAFLLPNTEKLFNKWRDLFMTMLVFFPAISIVFGGSQLAGQLIMQGANGDIFILIFGLAVQLAALALTPMILRFSGGVLGKIAQITNNPNKGIIDRSKNTARERAELARQRNIAKGPRLRNPASWGNGMVQAADFSKRRRKGKTEAWTQEATNRYNQTQKAQGIEEMAASANIDKDRITATNATRIERLKSTQTSRLHDKTISAQAAKEGLQTAEQDLSGYHNTLRTVGGTSLNSSQEMLDSSRMYSEASKSSNEAYLNEQRTFRFSRLGKAAERLEDAKLHAEGWQSQYTAHMDTLKVDPSSTLQKVAITAQAQKEAAEKAQVNVQASFDKERAAPGSVLNMSTLELEAAKTVGETAKANATVYLNKHRLEGGVLHVKHMQNEAAKLEVRETEGTLTRTIEEYKTGKLVRTGELSTVMNSMVESTAKIAAETQGASASTDIQTQNNATMFNDENHPLNDYLIKTAASVDKHGAGRAKARASATLNEASAKVRKINEDLLEDRALENNKTPVGLAMDIIKDVFRGTSTEDADVVAAAMELVARDAQIPMVRKMRSSGLFDQDALSAAILRNEGTLKSKGGFDLAAEPKLAGAAQDKMDSSAAFALGNISASNLPDMKFAAQKDYAERFNSIIANAESFDDNGNDPQAKDNAISGLKATYTNLTNSLTDPRISSRYSAGNLRFAIQMHAKLYNRLRGPGEPVDRWHSMYDRLVTDLDYATLLDDPIGPHGP